jgi:hypothetical protein
MIGSWDETDCDLALAFNAWSKGNGTSNQNTGEMPGYPNGNYDATFTNMASGYGYVYNAGDGYALFDGSNDAIDTEYKPAFTDASKHTWEVKLKYVDDSTTKEILFMFDDGDNFMQAFVDDAGAADGEITFDIKVAATRARVVTSTKLITGNDYTLHFVKNGATMEVYIDGVEASYSTQESYNMGNKTYTEGMLVSRTTVSFNSNIYWVAFYSDAISGARMTANAGLDNAMGLIGTNTSDVMALAAPAAGGIGQLVNGGLAGTELVNGSLIS